MPFDFGKAGALRTPDDRHLSDFDSAEGVLFRVKVVTAADPQGLLLAQADQIRPRKSTDEDENRIALRSVVPDENPRDEIWRLEFDYQQTLLKVNSALGDWRRLARDPVFLSLVYPAVFRDVLRRVVLQENHHDAEDADDWHSRWLRFAAGLPEVGDRPALKPLPTEPFSFREWKKVRVHFDYHVEIEGHYYSVLYHHVHEQLEARIGERTIEILRHGRRSEPVLIFAVLGRIID